MDELSVGLYLQMGCANLSVEFLRCTYGTGRGHNHPTVKWDLVDGCKQKQYFGKSVNRCGMPTVATERRVCVCQCYHAK